MTLFTIDETRCNRDGLCAADCPAGCIVFEKGRLPEPHDKKQAYCLQCGHCMAVCPTGALRLDCFAADVTPRDKGLDITLDQAEQFLTFRRSVRAFRDEPVDRDLLARCLRTAEYGPSGHNARPTRWSVALGRDKVAEVARVTVDWMRGQVERDTPQAQALHLAGIVRAWENNLDMVCRHAPALVAAHGPERGITPKEDAVIAVTYLELAATAAGLGACWCGYVVMAATYDPALRGLLGVDEGRSVYGALMLGRPARRYAAVPPRPEPGVKWL